MMEIVVQALQTGKCSSEQSIYSKDGIHSITNYPYVILGGLMSNQEKVFDAC